MKNRCFRALVGGAIAGATALAAAPSAEAAQRVITSPGPLTNIYLNDDLGCQVEHAGDQDPQFFGGTNPGDCGTFVAKAGTGSTVYGPSNLQAAPAAAPYAPVSQSPVTGAGSVADPFRVTTVVDVSDLSLTITQEDTYVVGEELYSTAITVHNSAGAQQSIVVYHAGDCFLQGDDGYGFSDTATGGIYCAAQPDNVPADRIIGFIPTSPGSHHMEGAYFAVWSEIDGRNFPDLCDCAIFQDNGAGLSWNLTVPAGGDATVALSSAFSPTGFAPPVTPPPPPELPPDAPFPPEEGELPPPVPTETVNAEPIEGVVKVKVPGGDGFAVLEQGQQIPVGSVIDTKDGTVELASAAKTNSDEVRIGQFYDGVFKVKQRPDGKKVSTTLQLTQKVGCGPVAARGKKGGNGLWGDERKGSHTTKGNSGAGTARGTVWFVGDRCNGSTVGKVKEGKVLFRDFVGNETVLLKPGDSYVAGP